MGQGPKAFGEEACSSHSGASREGDALEVCEPEAGKGCPMVLVGTGGGQGCGEDSRKRSLVRVSEWEEARPTHTRFAVGLAKEVKSQGWKSPHGNL